MLARTHGADLNGIDGFLVTVESVIGPGLPGLKIVGQLGGPTDDARLRVQAALARCGHGLAPQKQLVNLAPAEHRKESPGLDLAMACALLTSHGVIPKASIEDVLLWAELGADGRLRPVRGTLAVAELAGRLGIRRLVLAPERASEAARIDGLEVMPVEDLAMLVAQLRGEVVLDLAERGRLAEPERSVLDMADVRGLELPRLAVEVMVAGGHHLLLHGPSVSGKTMLADRVAGLLLDLDDARALEVARIHDAWTRRAPVRMPTPSVSVVELLGGEGRPGEFSLAHGGVLVLDELPEFADDCLEALRLPLEDGIVRLIRDGSAALWPARFSLLATMRWCPCGPGCCSKAAVRRYQAKVSGPILDRMDLVVPVDGPTATRPSERGEPSSAIRARITLARERQRQRLRGTPWSCNAELPASGQAIVQLCPADPEVERWLADAGHRAPMSTRTMLRLRRVAQTIADLDLERDPKMPLGVELFVAADRLRQLP